MVRNMMPVLMIVAGVLVAGLIFVTHGQGWASIILVLPLAGTVILLTRAGRRSISSSLPIPEISRQLPPPAEPVNEHITGVLLPSKHDDYCFLFSATVFWSLEEGTRNRLAVNMSALAVDAILRRACSITQEREPGNVTLVQHELGSELGKLQPEPSGRLLVMADSVQLTLPEPDQVRLERLATVRKEEAVWEHERKYEQSRREYLGADVLKNPGSAVVWWLTKNNDHVEKAVRDIGLLAQLSSAANNTEVPETFARFMADLAIPGTAHSGSNGWGMSSPEASEGSQSAADRFEAFLNAMDLTEDDPRRLLLARQVADLATAHGRPDIAADMAERFDPADDAHETEDAGEVEDAEAGN